VMGSATVSGEDRATRAAEMAISSPLLNNKNIHGAQKILLSIISGEEAELQMDELAQITDFMQESAGDDADVIFGHGIDSDLGDSIRVTVIATGFDAKEEIYYEEGDESKKVFDLESTKQIGLFEQRKANEDPIEETFAETEIRGYAFEPPEKETKGEDDEKILFEIGQDFEVVNKKDLGEDEELEELSGMAISQSRKSILIQKAEERRSKLRESRNPDDIDAASFKEKLEIPAYQRKNIHLQEVPHSSEKNLSRYSLTDDNKILGNNRFLHDNVD